MNTDIQWQRYGETDPYYGVLTEDKYKREHLTDEHLAEFFETGRRHVQRVMEVISAKVNPQFTLDRALDYGCGTGRIVKFLAPRCGGVVGADISEAMLGEARKNCSGLSNVEFMRPEAIVGTFSLIHTFIVLQHIPIHRGESIIRDLVQRLAPNGVGVLHVPYASESNVHPLRKMVGRARGKSRLINAAVNLFKRRPIGHPIMQMNLYRMGWLLRLLYATGCSDLHVEWTNHDGYLGCILFFVKRPQVSNW